MSSFDLFKEPKFEGELSKCDWRTKGPASSNFPGTQTGSETSGEMLWIASRLTECDSVIAFDAYYVQVYSANESAEYSMWEPGIKEQTYEDGVFGVALYRSYIYGASAQEGWYTVTCSTAPVVKLQQGILLDGDENSGGINNPWKIVVENS